MKKGKRAGGRSPRTPRGATRGVVPKRSEGRRQSRDPFKTDWHYLDTTDLGTTPKTAATERGGAGKDDKGKARRPVSHNAVASRKTPRAQDVVYWEPPPKPKPFYSWTDAEIRAWLDKQDVAYQRTAEQLATDAGVPLLEHERQRSEMPCDDCGFDGAPSGAHRATCAVGVVKLPTRSFPKRGNCEKCGGEGYVDLNGGWVHHHTPECSFWEEDDDDLPF